MSDLCTRYLDEHARQHKKPSSIRMDERNIANHILPLIGSQDVKSVTRTDIESLKQDIRNGQTVPSARSARGYRGGSRVTGGPGVANRCLALLSKMFNLAELWGWRQEHTNPVRLVAKYPEKPCERYLSDEELRRLGRVLADCEAEGSESTYVIAAIRLLLLTGARLGEILPLEWAWVNLDEGFLALPDSKTGRKFIFLPPLAVQILGSLERQPGNPYVIVGA